MDTHERIAAAFHREYEDRAPSYGYETRKDSAVQWEQVPENNRELMIAVVAGLCRQGIIEPGPNAHDLAEDLEAIHEAAKRIPPDVDVLAEIYRSGRRPAAIIGHTPPLPWYWRLWGWFRRG